MPYKEAMDDPLINQFLFYPRSISRAEIPDLEHGSVHTFPSGGGERISAYLYRPLPDRPVVLMFHGNGEVMTDYINEFLYAMRGIGLNFCVVDYRGYGLGDGDPCLSAILEDGRAAWDYFTGEVGIPAERIVLLGRSMGSIPALELASAHSDEFMGLVVESGIAGFHRWIDRMEMMIQQMGIDAEALKESLMRNLDHEKKIKAVQRPILILHTENDGIVPSQNARMLYEWAGPERATLNIFPMGDHNTIFYYNGEEYLELLKKFVEKISPSE